MRLELSLLAQADLDDIRDYSVAQFGVERAILYLDALEASLRRLLDYPGLGQPFDLRPGVRVLSAGEHRVFYRRDGERIVVARVLHKAMDVERYL